MEQILLTALGVGGATVLGAATGFVFRGRCEKYGGVILSFAAGVMMFSAITGLILPALSFASSLAALKVSVGLFLGGFCILLPERLFPSLRIADSDIKRKRAILTAFAIALHNLPEGIAAGVGFGTGDVRAALFIAVGIALQNIPEGCVVTATLVSTGVKPGRAFAISALTGLIEVAGTLLGYLAVSLSTAILPIALSFAAGAMLYVILCEMIPEIICEKRRGVILAAFLFGVAVMVAVM